MNINLLYGKDDMIDICCCLKEPRTRRLCTPNTNASIKPLSTEFTTIQDMSMKTNSSALLRSSRGYKVITEKDFLNIVQSSPRYNNSATSHFPRCSQNFMYQKACARIPYHSNPVTYSLAKSQSNPGIYSDAQKSKDSISSAYSHSK